MVALFPNALCKLLPAAYLLVLHLAAIFKQKSGPFNGSLFTNEDWNTDATIENGSAYSVSKVRSTPSRLSFLAAAGTCTHNRWRRRHRATRR